MHQNPITLFLTEYFVLVMFTSCLLKKKQTTLSVRFKNCESYFKVLAAFTFGQFKFLRLRGMYAYPIFTFITLPYIIFGCQHYHDPTCQDVNPIDGDHFTNQFIVEIEGGEEMAKKVARDIGFEFKKAMKSHQNHYFFTHSKVYERHKNRHVDVLKILQEHSDVKTADQQYVWHPTISELESFEDMVGLEEPLEVRTSHFHPDEVEIEGRSAWELVRPDDIFTEPEPLQDYPPIHTLVDFDKLYAEKNREKERRAQERRLQEALEKKLEEENTTATSVTLDSETDPQKEADSVENLDSEEKVAGTEETDEDETSKKVVQDEKTDKENPESTDDGKAEASEKIDEGVDLVSVDNGEVSKNEGELKLTGDERVLENPKLDDENIGSEIGGKITEESEANVASTVKTDDEVTVETYEE